MAYCCDFTIAADDAKFGQAGPRVSSPADGFFVPYLDQGRRRRRRRARCGCSAAATPPSRRSRWGSSTRSCRATSSKRRSTAWCEELLLAQPRLPRDPEGRVRSGDGRLRRDGRHLEPDVPALVRHARGQGRRLRVRRETEAALLEPACRRKKSSAARSQMHTPRSSRSLRRRSPGRSPPRPAPKRGPAARRRARLRQSGARGSTYRGSGCCARGGSHPPSAPRKRSTTAVAVERASASIESADCLISCHESPAAAVSFLSALAASRWVSFSAPSWVRASAREARVSLRARRLRSSARICASCAEPPRSTFRGF